MTEDQLLTEWHLLIESWFYLLQWWVGLSFGVVGVAHFAAKKLTLPAVVLILVVYVSHTLNSLFYLTKVDAITDGIAAELQLLLDMGEATQVARAWLESQDPAWASIPYFAAGAGVFVGSIAYLIMSYVQSRRAQAKSSAR